MATKKTTKTSDAVSPLSIGNSVLIRTVTYFQVGRIVGITETEVLLEDASWVGDTGRFNLALRTGIFDEIEPFVGTVLVNRGAIIDVCEWRHPLPKDVK